MNTGKNLQANMIARVRRSASGCTLTAVNHTRGALTVKVRVRLIVQVAGDGN